MSKHCTWRRLRVAWTSLLVLIACVSQSFAQSPDPGRIFGGYFEEWGIRYSGYNIADLQKNGVADQLTHLIYAFGNVTATASRHAPLPIRRQPIRIQLFRA